MKRLFVISTMVGMLLTSTVNAQHTARAQLVNAAATLSIAVSGNHFVNNVGTTIRPTGFNVFVNRCTSISGCTIQFAATDIKTWHPTMVRITLDEDCWLLINGKTNCLPTGTGTYANQIITYVQQLEAQGILVDIGLFSVAPGTNASVVGQKMPDRDHAPAFWTSVATAFKADQAVVFNLFNEPNGLSFDSVGWGCWENGGACGGEVSYTAAGMQELVTAVRNAGATTQPIVLNGISFAQEFGQFLTFLPTDPSNSLVAGLHSYLGNGCGSTSCIDSTFATIQAAGHPVLIEEFGEFDGAHTFYDAVMADADSKSFPWLAWAWILLPCTGTVSLITDATGTPSVCGSTVKSHLIAINP